MSELKIDEVRIKFQKLSIQKGWKQKFEIKQKQKSPKNKPKEEIWNIVEEDIEDSFSPVKTIPRALMEEICEEKNSFEKLPQRNRFIDDEASAEDASSDENEEFEQEEQEDSFINDEQEEDVQEFSESEAMEEGEETQEREEISKVLEKEEKEVDISIDFNESISDEEKEKTPKKEHSIIEISSDEEEKENILQNNRPSNINSIPSHRLSTQVFHDSPIQEEKKKSTKINTFVKEREKYLKYYYDQFNIRIFEDKLPKVKIFISKRQDASLSWSVNLTKTAGRCISTIDSKKQRSIRIEMSSKVIDSVERLKSTLVHEMCHAATFLIDKDDKPDHGVNFKKWGKKVTKTYPEITVTTTHTYEINYKYKYQCTGCEKIIGRFSNYAKSCGGCKGKLILLGDNQRTPNNYNQFIKENFSFKKKKFPNASRSEILKLLANDYRKMK
jgi:predicted SprT family Zn-dependent metalloprotease